MRAVMAVLVVCGLAACVPHLASTGQSARHGELTSPEALAYVSNQSASEEIPEDETCADVQPPPKWAYPSCDLQAKHGRCYERRAMKDGICERTCGVCVPKGDVEFMLILSKPRSASTSVAEEIADNRCSVSFNEMFTLQTGKFTPGGMDRNAMGCLYSQGPSGGDTCGYLPDGGCRSRLWASRQSHVLEVLKELRRRWCQRRIDNPQHASPAKACGSKCVVAVKIFGQHGASREDPSFTQGLEELMKYSGTRVVVVKRHPDTEECSYNYSMATQRWHHINHDQERSWQAHHCSKHASRAFAQAHADWYGWIAAIMRKLNKPYMELPFEKFVADVPSARQKLQALANLPQGEKFKQPFCPKTPGMLS